jgi:serine/threonine protein kinase/tetratricopeptide (TPR) repeat protein
MTRTASIDHSNGSRISRLSPEQEERLADVLDRYLRALESDLPLNQDLLVAEHPDLADELRAHFRSLDDLHGIAAGFGADSSSISRVRNDQGAGRIGDFELVREVGRGGMGVVYEARQISLDRRVAVKLLPFAAVLDSKQIARFKTEAQAAAQVQHPNIVPVFAIGVERGIHYYAMQFIDGQPLDRIICELREGRLPPQSPTTASHLLSRPRTEDETRQDRQAQTVDSRTRSMVATRHSRFELVARLGIQAAEALHAAHEYGVVHRDIKPSNLLLDANGKLWVTDFGLARCQRDATLTRTGDVVGTMRYMSPEQAAGKPGLVDHRTDVYSLGATLYELLCLHPVFPDENNPALLQSISQQDPPSLRHFYPDLPADLETVVLKAIAKSRDERYATALDLADDLRRVVEGRPTVARPPRLGDRVFKWVRRYRKTMTAAACALFLAFVALTAGLLALAREKRVAETNFQKADRYFHDARNVVDRFGIQLSAELEGIPGTREVREKLIRETQQYYQSFIDEAKANPFLRAELAATYGKIATLMDEAGSSSEAIAAHEKSVAMFAELAALEPGNAQLKKRLAQSKNNLALMLDRVGQVQRAEQLFEEAIALQQQLVQKSSAGEDLSADLAASYGNLGLLQRRLGAREKSQRTLQAAIESLEILVERRPSDADRLQELATVYNNLAGTHLNDQPKRAIDLHRKALRLQVAAADIRPDHREARRNVALTLNNLGAAWSRTTQIEEAVKCYEQAINMQQELGQQFPSQRPLRRDLAVSENNLGLAYTRGGRLEDAEGAFRRSLAIQESLLAESGDDVELTSTLGGTYNNLGIVLERSSRLDESAAAFAKAATYQQLALSLAPKIVQYRAFLSKHYVNLSRVLCELGKSDQALAAVMARRELWTDNPQQLFAMAEETAAVAKKTSNAPDYSSGAWATLAVELLTDAVKQGYVLPKHLEQCEPFAALTNNPQFVKLLSDSHASE